PPVHWLLTGEPRPLDHSLHTGTAWSVAAEVKNPTGEYLPDLAQWPKRSLPEGHFHGRVFATATQGAYLRWALPEDVPIFTYTHVHLFTAATWRENLRVRLATSDW